MKASRYGGAVTVSETGLRNLLGPVYSWFTQGFDTLDLKEAEKLVDELS
jgi:hypothetical protein